MVDEQGAQAQLHNAGMTGEIACRFHGRDFTTEETTLLCALLAAQPPCVDGDLDDVLDALRDRFGEDAIVRGRGLGVKLARQEPPKVE